MAKRSTKFYRKNESEIMNSLGLKPTKNSGAGWVEKGDGQNDYINCELKSTENASISIKEADINKLESQAAVSHKIPVFAINFIKSNSTYLLVKPEDIKEIAKYLEVGECELPKCIDISEYEEMARSPVKKIKSNKNQRDKFWKNKQEEWENAKANKI